MRKHLPYTDILDNFDLNDIPDLDVVVLGALELFERTAVPEIRLEQFKRPLVVGSGNAEAAGKIIFRNRDAIFASESSVEEKLRSIPDIDHVVVISAFGGKHAPGIIRTAKKLEKRVCLLTCNPQSLASQELKPAHQDQECVFPKNREPYTYNVSTYLGMILAETKEDPQSIYRFIEDNLNNIDFSRFREFDKFFLIVPNNFHGVISMMEVKFKELFGRLVARDIATMEFMSHATTVVPAEELFISFGEENKVWGAASNRVFIPLPENAGYGAMLAIGYYVIGRIQKLHPPYFKQNIENYVKQSSEIFGHEIKAIVEK